MSAKQANKNMAYLSHLKAKQKKIETKHDEQDHKTESKHLRLTSYNALGDGYTAMMALATSTLTFLNC
jgi:hypothetical protein